MLQKLQLQQRFEAADLRERNAEYAENAANSSDSEWLLAFGDWRLAPDKKRYVSAMADEGKIMTFNKLGRRKKSDP